MMYNYLVINMHNQNSDPLIKTLFYNVTSGQKSAGSF